MKCKCGGRQGDEDPISSPAATVTLVNKSGSAATTSMSGTTCRTPKSSTPVWLLRRQRSRWTYDESLGSMESGSTDAGSPSTVGTSVDGGGESPRAAAERRRRRMRRTSRASSMSVTCDGDSADSGVAGAELSVGWVDPSVGLGWVWVENFCF